jgi:hypothetical protein
MHTSEDKSRPQPRALPRLRAARMLLNPSRLRMPSKVVVLALVLAVSAASCVAVQPATDTGDPSSAITSITGPSTPTNPTTPTPATSTVLAYDPDMKPLFASDCVTCHGGSRVDGNYRMNTYAQVMTAVRAGSASSPLVTTTQQNGRMYRYFSGSSATRQSKAAQVLSWVVTYRAQETR